MTPHNLADK